jgi:hypothetical protein
MIVQFRHKTIAALAVVAVIMLGIATPPVSAQFRNPPNIALPVVGTVATGETFAGTMTLTSFAVQDGQVVARGILTGLLTNTAGVTTTVISTFATPVAVAQATCSILHLDLGPLNLNLLGLVVDLNEVVLDITAASGAGNLLGNLLCAVTGLLDSPGGLARLLNSILGVLGGL